MTTYRIYKQTGGNMSHKQKEIIPKQNKNDGFIGNCMLLIIQKNYRKNDNEQS